MSNGYAELVIGPRGCLPDQRLEFRECRLYHCPAVHSAAMSREGGLRSGL